MSEKNVCIIKFLEKLFDLEEHKCKNCNGAGYVIVELNRRGNKYTTEIITRRWLVCPCCNGTGTCNTPREREGVFAYSNRDALKKRINQNLSELCSMRM